jgi:mucin-19
MKYIDSKASSRIRARRFTCALRYLFSLFALLLGEVTLKATSAVDYVVTTTATSIVITDSTGNGDTLVVSEPSAGNIVFTATGRTFSVNGGLPTSGASDALSLGGVTDITVNAAAGADTINVTTFTVPMPSLTINGGADNDIVNLVGDITFAANANLDVDLQNDEVSPGVDSVGVGSNINLVLSGTGAATFKASKDVTFSNNSSVDVVDGGLTAEANQQTVANVGAFHGVTVSDAALRSSGAGNIVLRGRNGTSGLLNGVYILGTTVDVASTGTGSITVAGDGSAGYLSGSLGVRITSGKVRSVAGDIAITGTVGAGSAVSLTSVASKGILLESAQVTATGGAKITMGGTCGTVATGASYGLDFTGTTVVSAVDGDIQVNGTSGDSPNAASTVIGGIGLRLGAVVRTSGIGNVTVQATTGASSSVNYAVDARGGSITTLNGDISISGDSQSSNSTGFASFGILMATSGSVTSTGTGRITLNATTANSGAGTGSQGIRMESPSFISSNSGDITITGTSTNATAGSVFNHGATIRGNVTSMSGNIAITGTAGLPGVGAGNGSNGVQVRNGIAVNAGTGTVTLTGTAANVASSEGINISPLGTGSVIGSAVTLIADSIAIDPTLGTVNAGSGMVTLRPKTNSTLIDLGGADSAGTLGLTDAELDRITAGTLAIGDSNSGAIAVSAVISPLSYKTLALGKDTTFSATGGFTSDVTSASDYEKLTVEGTVAITSGATFGVASAGGYVWNGTDLFTFLANDSTDSITGTFTGPELLNFLGSTSTASRAHSGGTGNDFTIGFGPTVAMNTGVILTSSTTIIINGSGFDAATPANNTVTFSGGVLGTVTSATATQLTVTISNPAALAALDGTPLTATVTLNRQPSATVQIGTVTAPPTVTGISPATGGTLGGTIVTVTGTNFSNDASVTIGGVAAVVVDVVNGTSITCITGARSAGPADVVVIANGAPSTGGSGLYTYVLLPLVYDFVLNGAQEAPANASPGVGTARITIDQVAQTMRVQASFSGLSGTTSAAHLHGPTAGPGTGTAGVITTTPSFVGFPLGVSAGTMDQTYDLTQAGSFNPAFVTAQGGSVANARATLINGLNSGSVYFNVHTSAFAGGEIRGFARETTVNANLASLVFSAGTISPAFTTGGVAYTSSVPFSTGSVTVTATRSGPGAALSYQLNGAGFEPLTSGTASPSLALLQGANTVDVKVVALDGTTTKTYTTTITRQPPPPTVTGISPNTGSTAGGTVVTITGTGFTTAVSPSARLGGVTALVSAPTATVSIGGVAAVVNAVTSTSITATTGARAAGVVDVVVTVNGVQSTGGTGLYTYAVPAPTVTGISPNIGSSAGGTVVTISGTGFSSVIPSFARSGGVTALVSAPTATVSIGGVAAVVNAVTSTSITATTGARAAGVVDVVVTVNGAQSTGGTGLYTYLAPAPTVTSPTATAIMATTATLGGNVTSDGGDALSEKGVLIAPTAQNATPTLEGVGTRAFTSASLSSGVFTVPVTGLLGGTQYSYRAYAINGEGVGYSPVATFTTGPVVPVTTGNTYSALLRDGTGKVRGSVLMKVGASGFGSAAVWLDGRLGGAKILGANPFNVLIGGVPVTVGYTSGAMSVNGNPTVNLTVTSGGESLTALAERSPFALSAQTTRTGRYTFVAEADAAAPAGLPKVGAIMAGAISRIGTVRITARTSSGQVKTFGTQLQADESFPVYFGTTTGGIQSMEGVLAFTSNIAPQISGVLKWTLPAGASALIPAGVDADYEVIGARYSATSALTMLALPPSNRAELTLDIAGSGESKHLFAVTAAAVPYTSAARPSSIWFTSANGMFSGQNINLPVVQKFYGVVLQGEGLNYGAGYIVSQAGLGTVLLRPEANN